MVADHGKGADVEPVDAAAALPGPPERGPIRIGTHLEVSRVGDRIAVRDVRDVDDPFLYTLEEWRAFCAGAKAGEFDELLRRVGRPAR